MSLTPQFNKRDQFIKAGKIPPSLLAEMLALPRRSDPDVLVGPALGEDAAVFRTKSNLMVVTSDPITFPTPKPGHYAVYINANDISSMGASPRFFTLTMILAEGTPESRIFELMQEVIEASEKLNISLLGGHSEVSASVKNSILSVTMFGELIGEHPVRTSGGQAGDAVIQMNPLAIEGTSILANTYRSKLEGALGRHLVDRAVDFWQSPGISITIPAEIAVRNLHIHALHDPTEGGLASGLREIAEASRTGLEIFEDRLLIREETHLICKLMGVNPLGLISAGCLLFTVSPEEGEPAVNLLNQAGYPSALIGRLTDRPGEYLITCSDGRREILPEFEVDELARIQTIQ